MHTDTEPTDVPLGRRVSSDCPFCRAEPWHRNDDGVTYRCGSVGSHTQGHIKVGCLSPETVQQGPL